MEEGEDGFGVGGGCCGCELLGGEDGGGAEVACCKELGERGIGGRLSG